MLGWRKLGLEQSLGTRIVTYADDLVILCRKGNAEEALHRLREIMGKLKLTVNEEKTRICRAPEGQFDFLGYTFGRMYSARTGKAYLGHRPSKKSIKHLSPFGQSEQAWARCGVDEGVRSCPRAGCGRSACPVVCPVKAGVFSRR